MKNILGGKIKIIWNFAQNENVLKFKYDVELKLREESMIVIYKNTVNLNVLR